MTSRKMPALDPATKRARKVEVVENPPLAATMWLLNPSTSSARQAQADERCRSYPERLDSAGWLWAHDGRFYSVGARADAFADMPEVAVDRLDTLAGSWVEDTQRGLAFVNPEDHFEWTHGQFITWQRELAERYGLTQMPFTPGTRYNPKHYSEAEGRRMLQSQFSPIEALRLVLASDPWVLPSRTPRGEHAEFTGLRAAVREVLARDGLLDATELFMLRLAERADGICAAFAPSGSFIGSATFDLGAGRLLAIHGWRFISSRPIPPFLRENPARIDGGDIVLRYRSWHQAELEGSAPWLRGRRLREANAERQRLEQERDAEDDSDDDAGNYPSTTGNPSGGGRGNSPR